MIITSHDGVKLHCTVAGPDDAPLLLLLHGATLDRQSWAPQVDALSDRYLVVAPDLRGHGESLLDGPFTYADAVADIRAILAAFDQRPTVLVGLSMGGNIAQTVLRQHPACVVGAVLADCACNTAPRGRANGLITAMSLPSLKAYPRALFLKQAAQRTAVRPEVRAYVRDATNRMPMARVIEVMDALVRGAIAPDPGWRVPVPTMLLCGIEDKLAAIRKELPAWGERDAGCSFALIPQAGHASNQDNPDAFTALLVEHLDRVLPEHAEPRPRPRRRR